MIVSCRQGTKKTINKAAEEKQKDKDEVNRRYHWDAAAQEQLQVSGCLNEGTAILKWVFGVFFEVRA